MCSVLTALPLIGRSLGAVLWYLKEKAVHKCFNVYLNNYEGNTTWRQAGGALRLNCHHIVGCTRKSCQSEHKKGNKRSNTALFGTAGCAWAKTTIGPHTTELAGVIFSINSLCLLKLGRTMHCKE